MIRQFLFIILCLGISNAQEKQKTFSGDDIWGETNYRTTLHKAFPNLEPAHITAMVKSSLAFFETHKQKNSLLYSATESAISLFGITEK